MATVFKYCKRCVTMRQFREVTVGRTIVHRDRLHRIKRQPPPREPKKISNRKVGRCTVCNYEIDL